MANHIKFNSQTPYGAMLRNFLRQSEDADVAFSRVRDVMLQMRDGDGSQEAHYAIVQAEFGFESNAKAKAAFEELDSAYSKTSGNGSVSNVRAARDQLYAKLRG